MAPRLFGTDGIRGRVGVHPLDGATVTALGYQVARQVGVAGGRPTVLLAGDSRESTPRLCAWLARGLEDGGAEVRYAGLLPTPGVAWLVRRLGAAAGITVSASHNPHPDNGIKLFDGAGRKWRPAEEARLEAALPAAAAMAPGDLEDDPPRAEPELAATYLDGLTESLGGGRPLSDLAIVVDAANGAAAPYAARLFERLGARATALGAAPDGRNINLECGSTSPAAMAAATAAGGAGLGIALDGDADRAIFADERGQVRDGDAALYLWATWLARAGRLRPRRIVATTMSNLGLERALAAEGIELVRCDVGDRVVVETMLAEGLRLGGEQSGHLVHLDLSTTGDGLLTALQIAAIVASSGRSLSELLRGLRRFPQVLLNVPVASKPDLWELPAVRDAARTVESRLGATGRLVLRYSGTEPLARVMIEGPEQDRIDALAEELAGVIHREIGAAAEPEVP